MFKLFKSENCLAMKYYENTLIAIIDNVITICI